MVDLYMDSAFSNRNTRVNDDSDYVDLKKFCLKDSLMLEDIPNLNALVNQMYKEDYLSAEAYDLLKDLIHIVSDNYLGLTSDAVFMEKLEETISRFNKTGFDVESIEGANIGVTLAISKSSSEWWASHPEASNSSTKIAPWVAADVAGAIVGAAQSILVQKCTGSTNAKALLVDTLCSAVLTSTCATAKVMKFAKEFAIDLIKVLSL